MSSSMPVAEPALGAAGATLEPLSLSSTRSLTLGVSGAALFGLALRTAVSGESPGLGHLGWALALPAVLLLTWALCLPALYILWATRQPGLTATTCVQAALLAVDTAGQCLAATTPILWFFAATAPASRVVAPLALVFTGLALIASGAAFGQALRRQGADFGGFVMLTFLALLALTFLQCAHGFGLHWS